MGVLTALQRHKYSPSFREAEPKTPAILGARPGSGRGMALLSARYGKRLTRAIGYPKQFYYGILPPFNRIKTLIT